MNKATLIIAVFAITLFYHVGCSLIGFGIGSLVDSGHSDLVWMVGSEKLEITPGDPTVVVLRGESRVTGVIRNFSSLPAALYERDYAAFLREGNNMRLPNLQDTILVKMVPGKVAETIHVGEFKGFTIQGNIRLRQGKQTKSLALEFVDFLSNQEGKEMQGSELRSLLASSRIPLDVGILVQTDIADTLLPIHLIDSILVRDESNWRWVGLGTGAIIDAAVLVAAATAKPKSQDCSGPKLDGPYILGEKIGTD